MQYLLPIREAYEWKRKAFCINDLSYEIVAQNILLPIREAYEWKRWGTVRDASPVPKYSCFQFVKRMNGNTVRCFALPDPPKTCFQFVKRMNGNVKDTSILLRAAQLASNS